MVRHDLDSILPGDIALDDGDVISTVQQITPTRGAMLIQLRRANVVTGETWTELVRLRRDGSVSASLNLSTTPDSAERAIAEALAEETALGLIPVAGKVQSTEAALQPLAEAINGMSIAWIDRISLGSDWCAVQWALSENGPDSLYVLNTGKSPKPISLETDVLKLGGWRHMGGLLMTSQTLYVAISDPVAGFDLFHADLSAKSPALKPVITRGAQRFAINAAVAAMCVTDQGVLLGTAALSGPAQPVGDWGPELVLVPPSEPWDLVAGQPRFSPDGLLLPASSQMPGMGHPDNAAIMAIAHQDGQTVIALQSFVGTPCEDRRDVGPDLFNYQGPVRLMRSGDLQEWEEIPHNLPDTLGPVSCVSIVAKGIAVGHESLGTSALPVAFVAVS